MIRNSENMVIKIPLPRRLCHNYMLAPYIPSPLTKGEKVQSRAALHKIVDYGMPRAADEGLQEKQYFKCFLVEPLTPALSRSHRKDGGIFDSGRGGIGVFPATPRRDVLLEQQGGNENLFRQ